MPCRAVAAVIAALAVCFCAVSPAWAEDDLSGRWDSDSLRDNDIGYYLNLRPVADTTNSYAGFMRFAHRDGRRNAKMPITATVAGDAIVFTSEAFDKSAGTLRGRLDADGSMITLTNCRARLRLVMAGALDSDCVFRPAVRR